MDEKYNYYGDIIDDVNEANTFVEDDENCDIEDSFYEYQGCTEINDTKCSYCNHEIKHIDNSYKCYHRCYVDTKDQSVNHIINGDPIIVKICRCACKKCWETKFHTVYKEKNEKVCDLCIKERCFYCTKLMSDDQKQLDSNGNIYCIDCSKLLNVMVIKKTTT